MSERVKLKPQIRCGCRDCLAPSEVLRTPAPIPGNEPRWHAEAICGACSAAGCSPYGDRECARDDAWVEGFHDSRPPHPALTTGEAVFRFLALILLIGAAAAFFHYLWAVCS